MSPRRGGGGETEIGRDQLVFRIPDPRLLRLVARSVFLTAVVISLPWLRVALLATAAAPPLVAAEYTGSRWIDDPYFLPMLLRDLRRQGLLRIGDRAVFIGDPSARFSVLRENDVDHVPERWKPMIPDRSVDFVLAAEGFSDHSFGFIDRVLQIGGFAVVRLGSGPSDSFHLPVNYRIAYIRRFGSTVVAIKKFAPSPDPNADAPVSHPSGRRLLSDNAGEPSHCRNWMRWRRPIPEARKAALQELEDPLLEPPMKDEPRPQPRYLPELMGDGSLDGYSRWVFVDFHWGDARSSDWFKTEYPTGGQEFEITRKNMMDFEVGEGSLAEWLGKSVREEDFVVMKAEAGVVEEFFACGVIGLIDELFLECDNEWTDWRPWGSSKRAYWECIALYGKVRDAGVAVHQWWGEPEGLNNRGTTQASYL